MTDNEIIKTLERCETSNGYCYDCPLEDIAAIQNIQVCQDKLIPLPSHQTHPSKA